MKRFIQRYTEIGNQRMHSIRLLAGGYIVYLGIDIIKNFFQGVEATPLALILAIIMAICGLAIVGLSSYALMKLSNQEQPSKEENNSEK